MSVLQRHVIVVGETNVGKSTLLWKLLSQDDEQTGVPKTCPTISFPPSVTNIPHCVVYLHDTDASEPVAVLEKAKIADLLVIMFTPDNPKSLDKAVNFWIPEFLKENKTVPILLVTNKADLKPVDPNAMVKLIREATDIYKNILNHVAVSNLDVKTLQSFLIQVLRMSAYPIQNLVNIENPKEPTAKFRAALKRSFNLLDENRRGYLTNEEVSQYNMFFFGMPIGEADLVQLKARIKEHIPHAVTVDGFTFSALLYTHMDIIRQNHSEQIFDGFLRLNFDLDLSLEASKVGVLPLADGQNYEFTPTGVVYLEQIYSHHCTHPELGLSIRDMQKVFTDIEIFTPWPSTYLQIVPSSKDYLSQSEWGLLWKWCLHENYEKTVLALSYLGTRPSQVAEYIQATKTRVGEFVSNTFTRRVVVGYVIGGPGSGKSSILSHVQGKPFSATLPKKKSRSVINKFTSFKKDEEFSVLLKEMSFEEAQEAFNTQPHEADFAFVLYDPTVGPFEEVAQSALLAKRSCGLSLILRTKSDLGSSELDSEVVSFCEKTGISLPVSVSAKDGLPEELIPKVLFFTSTSLTNRGVTESSAWENTFLSNLTWSALETVVITPIVYFLSARIAQFFRK